MARTILYGARGSNIVLSGSDRAEQRRQRRSEAAQMRAAEKAEMQAEKQAEDQRLTKVRERLQYIEQRVPEIEQRDQEILRELQTIPNTPENRGVRNRLRNEAKKIIGERNRLNRESEKLNREYKILTGQRVLSRSELSKVKRESRTGKLTEQQRRQRFSTNETRRQKQLGVKPGAIGKATITESDVVKGGALSRAFEARRRKIIASRSTRAGVATMKNAQGREVAVASVDLSLVEEQSRRQQQAATIARLEGRGPAPLQSREGQGGVLAVNNQDVASVDLSLYAKQSKREQFEMGAALLKGTPSPPPSLPEPTTGLGRLWVNLNQAVAKRTTYKISDPFPVAEQRERQKAVQRYNQAISGIDPEILAASPISRKQDPNQRTNAYYYAQGFSEYIRERPVSTGILVGLGLGSNAIARGVGYVAGTVRATRIGQTGVGLALTSRRAGIAAEIALAGGYVGSEAYTIASQPSSSYRAYAAGGVTARALSLGAGVGARRVSRAVAQDIGTIRWQQRLARSDAALREPVPYVQESPTVIQRAVPGAGARGTQVDVGVELPARTIREEVPTFSTQRNVFGGYETNVPDTGAAYARAIGAARGGRVGTSFQTSLRPSITDPVTARTTTAAERAAIIARFQARAAGQRTLTEYGIENPLPQYARGALGSGPARTAGYQRSLTEYTRPINQLLLTGPEAPTQSGYPFYQRRIRVFGRDLVYTRSGTENQFRLGTFGAGARSQTTLRFDRPRIFERSPSRIRVQPLEPTLPETPSLRPISGRGSFFGAFRGPRRTPLFGTGVARPRSVRTPQNYGLVTPITRPDSVFGGLFGSGTRTNVRPVTSVIGGQNVRPIDITTTGLQSWFRLPPPVTPTPSNRPGGGGFFGSSGSGRGRNFVPVLPAVPAFGALGGGSRRRGRRKRRKYKTSRSALNLVFGVQGINPLRGDVTGLLVRGR